MPCSRLMEQPSMGTATRWHTNTVKPMANGASTCGAARGRSVAMPGQDTAEVCSLAVSTECLFCTTNRNRVGLQPLAVLLQIPVQPDIGATVHAPSSSNVLTGMWASSEARRASVAANTTNTRTCTALTLDVVMCIYNIQDMALVSIISEDGSLLEEGSLTERCYRTTHYKFAVCMMPLLASASSHKQGWCCFHTCGRLGALQGHFLYGSLRTYILRNAQQVGTKEESPRCHGCPDVATLC